MQGFKKFVMLFVVIALYFSIIGLPLAVIIDCLMEIEQRISEMKE